MNNNLKLLYIKNNNNDKKFSPRLSYSNLKKISNTGLGYNSKIISLAGYCKSSRVHEFGLLLKRRENSVKILVSVKNKLQFNMLSQIRRTWLFLKSSKFYKGVKFSKGLPVHGQRTHTNAKTAKNKNKLND